MQPLRTDGVSAGVCVCTSRAWVDVRVRVGVRACVHVTCVGASARAGVDVHVTCVGVSAHVCVCVRECPCRAELLSCAV